MSVKKMIDLYVNFGLGEDTWPMMYNMVRHGLISYDNWTKFFNKCKDWDWSDDGRSVIDGSGKILYTHDADGFLVKVA